ncbi:MAG: hypothetical protein H6713_12775 [Myxococcales bacterium]|nr:hypothetical protein [Myxococcales bacterium]
MPVDSLTFTHHATRRGAPLPKMYGPVLRPREPVDRREPSHQTWFVGDAGGMVGALLVDDALLVATGAEGRAWTVEPDGRVAELTLETGTPPEVAVPTPPAPRTSAARTRSRRSASRVQPAAGRRVALTDGLSFATHNTAALGRLLRGRPPRSRTPPRRPRPRPAAAHAGPARRPAASRSCSAASPRRTRPPA